MTGSEVVQVTEGKFSSRAARRPPRAAFQLALWGWAALQRYTPSLAVARPSTTICETGQVRPLALSPSGNLLYAVNTPPNHLEILAVHSLRGHLHHSRITVLGTGGDVLPRQLNKPIHHASCCALVPTPESEASLAQPNALAITRNGATRYVAALGSRKIGIYDTHQMEQITFVPDQANQIGLSGGGPTGLVLDDREQRLFVLTRFDNSITVIDTTSHREVSKFSLYNPEPASIKNGRRFLHDARHSSAHGDSSCASRHVFTRQPMPPEFHPMKGPTTMQSLRGMQNTRPMHWRSDHTVANDKLTMRPDDSPFNEFANFQKFQAGFTDLPGRSEFIADAATNAFAGYLQVTYPRNPIRTLDNSLTAGQAAGRGHVFDVVRDGTKDGRLDGDEQAAGSDPPDPHDTPLWDHN